jgi:hypothetical protein
MLSIRRFTGEDGKNEVDLIKGVFERWAGYVETRI